MKKSNGGYIDVDFKNLDVSTDTSETSVTVEGLYSVLTNAIKTNKEIRAINLKIADEEISPTTTAVYVDDDDIIVSVMNYAITVTDEDNVIIRGLS